MTKTDSEKRNTRVRILMRCAKMEPMAQSRQLTVEEKRNIVMERVGKDSFLDFRRKKATYICQSKYRLLHH